jgi:hypothetical protein
MAVSVQIVLLGCGIGQSCIDGNACFGEKLFFNLQTISRAYGGSRFLLNVCNYLHDYVVASRKVIKNIKI